jgi:uncharacterized protein (TIGR02271 family)
MSYGDTNQSTASSTSTVTAFFESRSDADNAVEKLVAAGIGRDTIRLVAGKEQNTTGTGASEHKGFWASLEDMFFPDDDRAVYSEGLRRGGYLVTVSGLDDVRHDTAVDILDDEGSIDLDERSAAWKTEGWSPAATDNGYLPSAAPATSASSSLNSGVGDEEVIPVVKEELRVGKRDVNNGRVRVRAYTVETPVSEHVSLRDENVTIERRPVDRALTGTEAAFTDRTIEAEEHHEEAVIAKDARVVEEISLRKTAEQRTETVSDSVRKTEIEVEDERSGNASTVRNDQSGKRPV